MTPFASAPPQRKALLIASAAVLGAGALGSLTCVAALAGLHQLRPSTDLLQAAGWLWRSRSYPVVQRWIGIGAGASIGLGIAGAIAAGRRLRPPLHGAARFATEGEIRAAGLRGQAGIIVGRSNGRFLVFGGVEHVLLHAPTRSGKGVGVVIPNLLAWPGSAVVLDIKKENYQATAGYRAAAGQTVFLFDPLEPSGRTARFNPLDHIDRSNPIQVLDELQKIAGMLFPVADRSDPFWAEAARTGFIGVGAFIAETPALPFTLGEIFRQLTAGAPRQRFPEEITERARRGRPLSPGCVSALSDFCSASDNTFASIKQTITSRMGLWLNPRVDHATSASDFDLRSLALQRITLYLGASPDNMARVAPLYNLLFQELVDLNTRRLPPPGPAVAPVLLLLDEFARLGVASVLAQGFSFIAGYGLRILAVVQSPAQLRAVYGPDLTEEIITNCAVEVVFTPKELRVAEELSQRLGAYTYAARSRSWPHLLSDGRRTTSESDQRRALRLPQELTQMDPGSLLVLRAGIPPVRGRKIRYYQEKAFTRRLLPAPPPPPPAAAAKPSPSENPAYGLSEIYLERREMTVEEAAGEVELSLEMVLGAVRSSGVAPPPEDAGEEELHAFARAFIAAAGEPPSPALAPEIRHG